MRFISWLLIFSLIAVAAFAQTTEGTSPPNFWQEFDIVFWQTMPFAVLWSHILDRNVSAAFWSGAEVHWGAVIITSTLISAGNAYLHATKAVKNERTGSHH